MSSLFVQTTVAPTCTVSVCGPKLKLSIFTPAFPAEGWSAAVTLGDPANSSSAINTGIAKLAIHTFFLVIFLFPFYVRFSCLIFFVWNGSSAVYPRVESTAAIRLHFLHPESPRPRVANRRLRDCDRSPHSSRR